MPFYEFDIQLPTFNAHSTDEHMLAVTNEASNLAVERADCRLLAEGDAAVLYHKQRGLLPYRTDRIVVAPLSRDRIELVSQIHDAPTDVFTPTMLMGRLDGKLYQLTERGNGHPTVREIDRQDVIVPHKDRVIGILYEAVPGQRRFPIHLPADLFNERSHPMPNIRNAPKIVG